MDFFANIMDLTLMVVLIGKFIPDQIDGYG